PYGGINRVRFEGSVSTTRQARGTPASARIGTRTAADGHRAIAGPGALASDDGTGPCGPPQPGPRQEPHGAPMKSSNGDERRQARAFSPAGVGNIGVGFDLLGHSIEGPGDHATVRRTASPTVRIS